MPRRRLGVSVLLALISALLSSAGCERTPPAPAVIEEARLEVEAEAASRAARVEVPERGVGVGAERRELTWTFEEGAFGRTDVVVSIPPSAEGGVRFPVLVALHGRGESLRGSRRGARGWLDDYQLAQAMARLGEGPLNKADFKGYVSRERLRHLNRALAEQPYAGLIVVCPYLPDVLHRDEAFEAAERLAAFIVEVLLPRVYAETPAIGAPAATGIDGVSLGGRASLLVGFSRPRAFGAVGALQAALDRSEVERFAELGARALAQNPSLSLRLLTSDADHFRRVNERLASALRKRGVRHDFLRVRGTHGYRFNRGPGGIEMLLFHDRVLRGGAWP